MGLLQRNNPGTTLDTETAFFSGSGFKLDAYEAPPLDRRTLPGIPNNEYRDISLLQEVTYTQEDLLLNALYMFLILVCSAIVVGGLSFGISEYAYMLMNKSKSTTSAKLRADNTWSIGSAVSDKAQLNTNNGISKLGEHAYPTVNHRPEKVTPPCPIILNQPDGASRNGAIDIIETSPPFNDCYSIVQLMDSEEVHVNRRYKMKELVELEPEGPQLHYKNIGGGLEQIPVEEALRVTTAFPLTRFSSPWHAEKTISEVRMVLMNSKVPAIAPHDCITKKIYLTQLISIGVSNTLFDNANVFVASYSDLIEHIVDTGAVFDLLEEAKSQVAVSLVEVILQYCWAHWNFRAALPACQRIVTEFEQQKQSGPFVQPASAILRFLCNLELGLYSGTRLEVGTLEVCESKIVAVCREICQRARCNDYLSFMPMIAQAVDICERKASKLLFYELLETVVRLHCDCCMLDYVGEDKTDLKALIQHGLWVKNDPEICKKAEQIHCFLVQKYPQTMKWWKEVEGGRLFAASACPEATTNPKKPKALTPGSWNSAPGKSEGEESEEKLKPEMKRSPSIRNFANYTKKHDKENHEMVVPGAFKPKRG
ncbi:hypothetical protein BABINDRAFT_165281 [Babjeviella inositovora NRRL Y-12698]|uniref:Uncharacterized protein n=1 Tax=Babjeviella inositovora NRRL Y-12698 TaxID=984486 RepID=A0A1E3QVS6_9ASCO|nr:uncharacterized protein BABINDRAFT_165281 [Babjeviella inositovora NRRL Y-12698]ODQ81758.1 hypothetical protein BABINDRAFT_165281 [Babjeviella inositovora NRRL Y-12698]